MSQAVIVCHNVSKAYIFRLLKPFFLLFG